MSPSPVTFSFELTRALADCFFAALECELLAEQSFLCGGKFSGLDEATALSLFLRL